MLEQIKEKKKGRLFDYNSNDYDIFVQILWGEQYSRPDREDSQEKLEFISTLVACVIFVYEPSFLCALVPQHVK